MSVVVTCTSLLISLLVFTLETEDTSRKFEFACRKFLIPTIEIITGIERYH